MTTIFRSIVGELVLAYMDATFSVVENKTENKIASQDDELAEPVATSFKKNAKKNKVTSAKSSSKKSVPAESPSSKSASAESPSGKSVSADWSPTAAKSRVSETASANSSPKKSSRRTTSLDLLYQNIK